VRRERLFENVSIPDPEDVKSDPDNVAYYQGLVFELFKQLGPGFTLRLLARTIDYMIRLRSKAEGEESPDATRRL
jgi:hypothetical protein